MRKMESSQKTKKGFVQSIKDAFSRILDSLNFKKMSFVEAFFTAAFLIIMGLMVFLYAYTWLKDETLFTRIILQWFVIPVTQLGIWGVFLYYGIMMVLCIVAPIPSELVQIVGGLLYGVVWGAFFSLTGIMITSYIGYTIAVKGGARVVAAAIGDENVVAIERFIGKYGIWAMIIGRGIPFIPFDLLTYGAGLVKMKPRDFALGTLIGTIPRSIFYAYIGNNLFPGGIESIIEAYNRGELHFEEKINEVSAPFNIILLIIFGFVGGGLALFQFAILPKMRRDAEKEAKVAESLKNASTTIIEQSDEQDESDGNEKIKEKSGSKQGS